MVIGQRRRHREKLDPFREKTKEKRGIEEKKEGEIKRQSARKLAKRKERIKKDAESIRPWRLTGEKSRT